MFVPLYQKEILVEPQHLDAMGHVNNTWHVHWMQEIAIEHSAVNGWGLERYLEVGVAWFVRRHTVNYLHPIQNRDTVIAETWIHELGKVSCIRQYRFTRKADGQVLATAETKWGMVCLKTGRPTKVPEVFLHDFETIQRESSTEET